MNKDNKKNANYLNPKQSEASKNIVSIIVRSHFLESKKRRYCKK